MHVHAHEQACTLGCETAMFSMAMELIHSPPDLITSLLRSMMVSTPYLSRVPTSPEVSKLIRREGMELQLQRCAAVMHHNAMECLILSHKSKLKSRAA